MRYKKAQELFRLAQEMQRTRSGVSLRDIEEQFGISRRSAERLRDAVERVFPQMEAVDTDERTKRWRLPPGVVNSLIGFTAEELAGLQNAVALMERENLTEQAGILAELALKVQALVRPEAMRHVEPDLEALTEAEGLAMRPGPRPVVDEGVLADLREAIKACRVVRLHYRARTTGALSRQTVQPYGFLYGNRHYLVAYNPSREPEYRGYRLYGLSNIGKVDVTERPFERRPDFSLKEYAERSFGTFQEEPFDVAWRFSPEAAADAREFLFHPTQTMEDQPDGALTVRFRAGGALEMSWHLFTWGDQVEVLEPQFLKDMLDNLKGPRK